MDKSSNKIKSISPDPVIEAVLDLRFTSTVPKEAVFGAIYNVLRNEHSKPESLPITQLPEALRLNDPSLCYKPWYRLRAEGYFAGIGPDVVTINCDCSSGYLGWPTYKKNIQRILAFVEKSDVVKKITRVGLRYISFFGNLNIFDEVNVSITREGDAFTKVPTMFTTVLENGDFKQRISLKNDAQSKTKKVSHSGSVIDIDTFIENKSTLISSVSPCIDEAHTLEKSLFFSLLKPPFIDTLNPEYEN